MYNKLNEITALKYLFTSRMQGDMDVAMADKLMYIPYGETQNY